LDLHGARTEHLELVPVTETFNGATVWDGFVEVFSLPEHPTGKAYAWRHEANAGLWRYPHGRPSTRLRKPFRLPLSPSIERGRSPDGGGKKRMGRPLKPKGEAKAEVLTLRLTPAERKAAEAAAKRAGLPISEWARGRSWRPLQLSVCSPDALAQWPAAELAECRAQVGPTAGGRCLLLPGQVL
jgi:hypothetical protein